MSARVTPSRVNETVAALIDRDDPADPIARQFIPDAAELITDAGRTGDPIGDAALSPVEGIVHRYPDRVLLKLLHACPVYCRFCFRRESVGPGGATHLSPDALDRAFGYIAAHDEIFEVILTGGDPLILSLRRLEEIFDRLRRDRACQDRAHPYARAGRRARRSSTRCARRRCCARSDKTVYVALHANHRARTDRCRRGRLRQTHRCRHSDAEPERSAARRERRCRNAGGADARLRRHACKTLLSAPSRSCARHRRISASPIAEGQKLVAALRGKLSGLCQPHYMLDIPGGFGKVPIDGAAADADGRYRLRDFHGVTHLYPPQV